MFYAGRRSLWVRCAGLCALDLVALEAAGADVSGLHLAVADELDLLHIGFERSSRLAVAVAHVVAGILALIAYTAYSRHIFTPPGS